MAAGLLTVANDSGGPKADIVVDFNGGRTGYLAHDVESYANALKDIILLSDHEKQALRERARQSVRRFTDENFDAKFYACLQPFFP